MSMVENKPKKTAAAGTKKRRKKPAGASTGISATDLQSASPPGEVADLHRAIEAEGGRALASYREPYGGHWVVLASLPIDRIEPTPYQRNISEMHVRKLENVIVKIGRFLDPVIAVRNDTGGTVKFWTPNGNHRLAAMRTLGAKSIVAIVVPEARAAYQILALNTEKAHNLREKALEVARMYAELARFDDVDEETYALEFEEPGFITLGFCYEDRPRFSGGAYNPILRRVDQFLKQPIRAAMGVRKDRAARLLALDDAVTQKVEALKSRGLASPYLKSFVVARINPTRFRSKDAPPLEFDEVVDRMTKTAAKFDPTKISMDDLARSGGAAEDSD
jgi:ParB family transcriptional regulator, chromosome partitioning protein